MRCPLQIWQNDENGAIIESQLCFHSGFLAGCGLRIAIVVAVKVAVTVNTRYRHTRYRRIHVTCTLSRCTKRVPVTRIYCARFSRSRVAKKYSWYSKYSIQTHSLQAQSRYRLTFPVYSNFSLQAQLLQAQSRYRHTFSVYQLSPAKSSSL